MTVYLLDANVLIALTVTEHEHHQRASIWAGAIDRFAVCPIVEGALIRFVIRIGESTSTAVELLRSVHAMPGCDFWPDSVSYTTSDIGHVRGHRQVTDAYLVSLASSRPGSMLATFDGGLASEFPDHSLLVP